MEKIKLLVIHPGYSGDLNTEKFNPAKWKRFKLKGRINELKNKYKKYLAKLIEVLKEHESLIFTSRVKKVKDWLKKNKVENYKIIKTPYGDPVPESISTRIEDYELSKRQIKQFYEKHLKGSELLFAGELFLKDKDKDSCVKMAYELWTKGINYYKKDSKWVKKGIKIKSEGDYLLEACFPEGKV